MGTMAMAENPAVESMMERLQNLLWRARTWKRQPSIEPPLPSLDFTGQNGLPNELPSQSTQLHNALVEAAARRIFHQVAASAAIQDPAFAEVWNLFDILCICGDQGQCDSPLVWLLLEELLDVESIEGCRIAFDYLESRRERLTAKNFKSKNLIILRSCNELLRRLSRAEDTVFCGRVYIFLFQSFPLGDKSSVNLRGEFHTENATKFEQTSSSAEETATNDASMSEAGKPPTGETVTITVSNGEEKAKDEKKSELTIDELYPAFWTLQKAFSNPPRIFAPEYLTEFKNGLDATLAMFKKVPRVIQATGTDEKRGVKRKAGEAFEEFASTYNPKYLTSRELFSLELSDLAFQRHILVQALILLDFLISLSEKSKKRLAHLNTQKSLQYSLTLSEQDTEWATNVRAAIANYLQDGPEGKFYYRMVDTVLSRDKNWVRWKMESCPPIAKAPVTGDEYEKSSAEARATCTSKRVRQTPMGALDLGFLTQSSRPSSQIMEDDEKPDIPTAESLLKGIEGDELDLEMASSEQEKTTIQDAKQNKTWRLLRVMSKKRLRRFKDVKENAGVRALFQESAKADEPNGVSATDAATLEASEATERSSKPEQIDDATKTEDVLQGVNGSIEEEQAHENKE